MKFANPATFLAQDKNVVDEAWPGDVVGLYDTGTFKIGDTLTEGEDMVFAAFPFSRDFQRIGQQRPDEEQTAERASSN